jgi:MscS family membrane protein
MDLSFLQQTFYDIPLSRYLLAIGVLLVALALKRVFAHLVSRIAFPFAEKTETVYDDLFLAAINKPLELLFVIGGFWVGVQILQLPIEPVNAKVFAYGVLKLLITVDVAWAVYNLVYLAEVWISQWVSSAESELDDHLLPFVRKFLRIAVVVIATLIVVQNLGFSITGLIASLGIGGLAVALAAQDTLANVFGSFMIIADRPFRIGDVIKYDSVEGKVEEVGFRSTRIRTFDRALVSVPNRLITNTAVTNMTRITERRVRIIIGVTYDTKPAQMRQAVEAIRTLLAAHEGLDQTSSLVYFNDFGASSLDILVQYFTLTTVMPEHLAIREEIGLQIMDALERLGLQIAFPSRTLYLHQLPAAESPAQ